MMEEKLIDFQRKVFAEYKTAKSLKESVGRVKKDRADERQGCLSVPKLIFADWVLNKAYKSESRKKNYAENEREAKELLRQKEIRDRICQTIAKKDRLDILTEEKFVNELTAALYQSDLASRFVIPENAVLYAAMATQIFDDGLETFCIERKADE